MNTTIDEKKLETSTDYKESEYQDFSDINERALLWKMDLHLLPLFAILYLLSFLDRGNIGNAKIEGLDTDLNLKGSEYNLCLTIFFIFYAAMEVPSNMILKRTNPRIFIPLTVCLFAVVMTTMGTVKNFSQLMATRALLGIFESSLFPGVSYFLSMYYKRSELLLRQSIFFSAASMAGAFSGLLAAGISKMDGVGGYEGWRWIFILEGLLTFVVAAASFAVFPRYPKDASFLTEREKEFISIRVHMITGSNGGETLYEDSNDHDRRHFWAVLKDWQCWGHLFCYMGVLLPLYGISLFTPTIIKNLGFGSTESQLLSVPIYVVAAICSIVQGYISDRVGQRSPFLVFNYACMVVGYVVCVSLDPRKNPRGVYAGIYICALGIYPGIPVSIVWCANNLLGAYKRAIGMAFQIGLANFSGAFVSNFYREQDKPRYILGHALVLMFIGIGGIALIYLIIGYRISNGKKRIAAASNDYNGVTAQELVKMGDKSPYFEYRL